MEKLVFIDFETQAIDRDHPLEVPEPVSMGWMVGSQGVHTIDWGHPDSNPAQRAEAIDTCKVFLADPEVVFVGHNVSFDLKVMCKLVGVPYRFFQAWDTLLMSFLCAPYSPRMDLKNLSRDLTGGAFKSDHDLKEWAEKNFGRGKGYRARIAEMPFSIVRPYLEDDVLNCAHLFKWCNRQSESWRGRFLSAYNREWALSFCLLEMEKRGVPVDGAMVDQLIGEVADKVIDAESFLASVIGGSSDDLASGLRLAQLLEKSGVMDMEKWDGLRTPTGRKQTGYKVLEKLIMIPEVKEHLSVHKQGSTYLSTFLEAWRGQELLHPHWNQIRSESESGGVGARTGRMSTTGTNLLNIPKRPVAGLPNLRSCFVPEPDGILLVRDYDAQEFRLLAHFEQGKLFQAFQEDPNMDPHEMVRGMMAEAGFKMDRDAVKRLGFGLLYGMGVNSLAGRLGCSVTEARSVVDTYYRLLPDIRDLRDDLKTRAARNEPFYTIGGRRYFCEEAKVIQQGVTRTVQTYEYKMLNTLIQGSAADVTKEALLRASTVLMGGARVLLAVHDELVVTSPLECAEDNMNLLEQAMRIDWSTVPMLSSGKFGFRWSEMWREE